MSRKSSIFESIFADAAKFASVVGPLLAAMKASGFELKLDQKCPHCGEMVTFKFPSREAKK